MTVDWHKEINVGFCSDKFLSGARTLISLKNSRGLMVFFYLDQITTIRELMDATYRIQLEDGGGVTVNPETIKPIIELWFKGENSDRAFNNLMEMFPDLNMEE